MKSHGKHRRRLPKRASRPKVAESKGTEELEAGKARLRASIAADPQLTRDFEFFANTMGWNPEQLLQLLYWDCNMVGVTLQTLIVKEKRKSGPLPRKSVEQICDVVSAQSSHSYFPPILARAAKDLRFTQRLAERSWPRREAKIKSGFESARQNSLYERIRVRCGQYHSVRLHRLVNAARHAQGFPPIMNRAFTIWLNRLKKRAVQQGSPHA